MVCKGMSIEFVFDFGNKFFICLSGFVYVYNINFCDVIIEIMFNNIFFFN